jgi:hypothetical protein
MFAFAGLSLDSRSFTEAKKVALFPDSGTAEVTLYAKDLEGRDMSSTALSCPAIRLIWISLIVVLLALFILNHWFFDKMNWSIPTYVVHNN